MEHAQTRVCAWVNSAKSVQQAHGCVCVCVCVCVCIARKNCANASENVPTEPTQGHVCLVAVTMTSNSND